MPSINNTSPQYHPFVLSGGGARGFAHLGVLKAFAEQQVFPQVIAATSAGSIAAAFICDGYSTDEVKTLFQRSKVGLSMQWTSWRSGFLSLKAVEQLLQQHLRHKNFEDLAIPLYVTATNFITGTQKIFSSGPLIPALLAAASIPVLFTPVEIDGIPYVDGGLSGNLPAEPLLHKYKKIIGVHVNPLMPYNAKNGFLANVERTVYMAIQEGVLKNRGHCQQFIEPEGLATFGIFDFKKQDAIYKVGLDYTRQLLQQTNQQD
jgi:NTE family protein